MKSKKSIHLIVLGLLLLLLIPDLLFNWNSLGSVYPLWLRWTVLAVSFLLILLNEFVWHHPERKRVWLLVVYVLVMGLIALFQLQASL